jgi:putative endonuclease
MWFVYIIQNEFTKEIYIGFTKDIKRRLIEHNMGIAKATYRKRGKWILIYAEVYRNKKDAYLREQRLKHHGRAKQELLKRIKNSLL